MTESEFNAITRRVYEYAYGIDTRDWTLYRSIFADEIWVDFSSYNANPGTKMTADDWVSGVQPLFTGLDATQHVMTNPIVDIDGRQARCRMYMKAEHFLTSDQTADQERNAFAIGGYYDNELINTDNGWLIEKVVLNVFWRRGNPEIMMRATEIGRQMLNRSSR